MAVERARRNEPPNTIVDIDQLIVMYREERPAFSNPDNGTVQLYTSPQNMSPLGWILKRTGATTPYLKSLSKYPEATYVEAARHIQVPVVQIAILQTMSEIGLADFASVLTHPEKFLGENGDKLLEFGKSLEELSLEDWNRAISRLTKHRLLINALVNRVGLADYFKPNSPDARIKAFSHTGRQLYLVYTGSGLKANRQSAEKAAQIAVGASAEVAFKDELSKLGWVPLFLRFLQEDLS